MWSTYSFYILAFALPAFSVPLSPYVLHESRQSIPGGWTSLRRASPDSILPLRIGLVQPNIENIESYLLDVSDPASPNYGNHWSSAKVAQTFRPTSESVNTVRNWLTSEGISSSRIKLSKTGNWLESNVTVAEAENLLKTEYHVYGHTSGTEYVAGGFSYYLPEDVSKHVDLVTPTLHFDVLAPRGRYTAVKRSATNQPGSKGPALPSAQKLQNVVDDLEHCDEHVTPNCMRALYDFVYTPVATQKNSIGIIEYTIESYIPSDLDLFFGNFSPSQVGQRPKFHSIDGGALQTFEEGFGYNGESDLDLEYAMTLVGKTQPVDLYQTGDFVESASYNNLLDAFDGSYCTFEGGDDPSWDPVYPDPDNTTGAYEDCGTVTPPYIISTSYGLDEAQVTPFYTARQCTEYAKLGLMGVTVVYASGDNGVAGNLNLCLTPSGGMSAMGEIFCPTFPSSCPYVTSVGATQMIPGSKVTDPESACEYLIYSGGGFSNHFARPSYQQNAVNNFLTHHTPPYSKSIYNATGRGYPDISANGAYDLVIVNGEYIISGGTSCAAPVSASILSAVNDARLAVGKKSIGFINPAIYSSAFEGVFNDITNGTNPGCGTAGFSAVPGWDPVTGLGTPNFPKLLAKFLLLP